MATVRVPIACTLASDDVPGRVAAWRQFLADCVVAVARSGNELRLGLEDGESALLCSVELASREKACCGFFSFSIEIEADSRVFVITTPEEAAGVLDDLTELVPSELLAR